MTRHSVFDQTQGSVKLFEGGEREPAAVSDTIRIIASVGMLNQPFVHFENRVRRMFRFVDIVSHYLVPLDNGSPWCVIASFAAHCVCDVHLRL